MARPTGSRNRYGQRSREAMQAVFVALGGEEALLAWAKEHPTEYYKMWAHAMLPRAMEVSVEGDAGPQIVLNTVHVDNPEEAILALEKMTNARVGHWPEGQDAYEEAPATLQLQPPTEGTNGG